MPVIEYNKQQIKFGVKGEPTKVAHIPNPLREIIDAETPRGMNLQVVVEKFLLKGLEADGIIKIIDPN